jgi:ribose transport system ATP-binding protein
LFGLMGAGRSELVRILFGLDSCERGEVCVGGGVRRRGRGPLRRIGEGMALVTEDRRQEGLCLAASIADNLALVSLRRHARWGPLRWIDRVGLGEALETIRGAVRLTPTARGGAPVHTLSGGNQQKVVLAKWLLNGPKIFLLDEPTRGIDVGARQEIYQLIQRLADEGAGVLLISSELEELVGLCDRVLVLSHGEIRDQMDRGAFDRERMLRAALRDAGRREEAPTG